MKQPVAPSWRIALFTTLLMQIAATMLAQAMCVLGPDITRAAGVSPEQIGTLSAISSFGTVWFLMGGMGLLADVGPIRLLQIGVLAAAAGLALAMTGLWPVTILAAMLVGLGYGPAPPAGSQILMQASPPQHRGLIFSIKQAGAPIGSALAGLLLPHVAAAVGWTWALLLTALLAASTALVVEPYRTRLDDSVARLRPQSIAALFSPRMILTPFMALRDVPGLQQMACAGATFSIVQGCIFSLYVTFLVDGLAFDLKSAGAAFAVMQITGAVARITIGWIADRTRAHLLVIALLGLGSASMMAALSVMQAEWSWAAILAVSAATGFLSASWNGVLMSEMARNSPSGRVGETASAGTFFVFMGYVTGPAVFALIVRQTGSYHTAFAIIAAVPLLGSLLLFRLARRGFHAAHGSHVP